MICRKLNCSPANTLLEIGCGMGRAGAFRRAEHYGVEVVGIHLSKRAAEAGAQAFAPPAGVNRADGLPGSR